MHRRRLRTLRAAKQNPAVVTTATGLAADPGSSNPLCSGDTDPPLEVELARTG